VLILTSWVHVPLEKKLTVLASHRKTAFFYQLVIIQRMCHALEVFLIWRYLFEAAMFFGSDLRNKSEYPN
jgi:hypothetical protein